MLYRDSENGVVMGVCAGLAHRFDLNRGAVRIATFLSLLIFTVATVLVYFTAGFLLRDRPLHEDARRERQFWRSSRSAGSTSEYRYSRSTSRG